MHPFFQDYSFYGFVHRGGDEVETENTLEAFNYSSDLGFVYIETDVQATKDGKVVIFHDSNLKRLAGINKKVHELTLEEIRSIDLLEGGKIPLLSEALELFPELPRKLDYTIIPFAREQVGTALNIATMLRQQGSTVDCNFSMKKMKKTLQQAGESGAAKAILLFPDELSENKVVIRDLQLHIQNPIKITDLLSSVE